MGPIGVLCVHHVMDGDCVNEDQLFWHSSSWCGAIYGAKGIGG